MMGYPYVECDHHPEPMPGYLVCRHIKGIDDVAHLELATETSCGLVACAKCYEQCETEEYVLNNFIVSCPGCLQAVGIQLQTQ